MMGILSVLHFEYTLSVCTIVKTTNHPFSAVAGETSQSPVADDGKGEERRSDINLQDVID